MNARRRRRSDPSFLYTESGEIGNERELAKVLLGSEAVIAGNNIVLDACALDRTRVLHAGALTVRGTELHAVDAAGADMERSSWRECFIDDSRSTGTRLNDAYLDDVVFRACKMNLMQCQSSKVRRTRFNDCDLRGADFNGIDLTGTSFEGSDVTGADFSGAILKDCDFRRAIIEDIRVSPEQLNGVIVTSDQALYLARLFGLNIRE